MDVYIFFYILKESWKYFILFETIFSQEVIEFTGKTPEEF